MGKFTLNKTGQQINNILDKAVLTEGAQTINGNKTFTSPVVVKNSSLATFTVKDDADEHSIYMGTNAVSSWITVTDGISEPEHLSSTMSSSGFTVDKTVDDNITDLSLLTESKLEFQSNFDETYEPTDVTHYGKKSFSIVSGSDDLFYTGLDSSNKGHLNSMNDLLIGSNNGSTSITSSSGTSITSSSATKITGDEGVIIGQYASASSSDSLYPGNYYDYGTITEPLVVQLWSATNGLYEFEFTIPLEGTIPGVTYPTGIRWSGGIEPELQNGYTYVVTIRHNLASFMDFPPEE